MGDVEVNYMKKQKVEIPLLIACIISCLAISNGDTPLAPSWILKLKVFLNYGLCLWLLFTTNWKGDVKLVGVRIAAIIVWFILRVFHVYTPGSLDLVVTLSLIAILSTEGPILANVLSKFRYFLIVITILGFVSYIDAITGMHLPHTLVPFTDVDDSMGIENTAFYLNHYFSYTLIQSDGPRLCTLFNEPGYYGTMVAFMLILTKFDFRDKYNWVLLVGGILSMSMAFFLLLGLGIFLYSIHSTRQRVLLVIAIIFVTVILPKFHFDSDIINNLLYRFEFDTETMSFVGDDRSNYEVDRLFSSFNNSDKTLFGYGTGYCNNVMNGASTYKKFIIEWGYLGSFLTYGLLMLAAFLESRKNKSALSFVFCFLISVYQRPSVFTMAYMLVLFGGIYYMMNSKEAYDITHN